VHVHLPKPLHGWREFIGEVGIVFLGVLIALGAEQLIETWHWSHKVSEVRANLVTEMRDDNGAVAAGIITRSLCADEVLDRMVQAMDRNADRQEIAAIARTYPILSGTFDNQAFAVAQSSETLLHGSEDELVDWGGEYGYLPVLSTTLQREWESAAVFQSWSGRHGRISDAEEQRALDAIGTARAANGLARKAAASLLTSLQERFGLSPARQDELNLYRRYRDQYGRCAIDVGRTDLHTLRSSEVRLVNSKAR
jgi:hypothetical protein